MHVEPIRPQVEDGISDELTGTVKRHVAAAARFEELDAFALERLRRGQDVRPIVARPDPERDDGRMLEEKELIGNPVGLALFDQLLLKLERLAVLDHAEAADFQHAAQTRALTRRSLPAAP